MIRPWVVLGVARAEARISLRLVRYWVFVSLGALFAALIYLVQFSLLHYLFSTYSGTAGSLNGRYFIGAIGFYYMPAVALGLVFLGFDLRARDRRDRVAEVVDARPYSNLELISGRLIGIAVTVWVPLIGLLLLLQLLGWLFMSTAMEWRSLAGFGLVQAPAAFLLVLSLTFLVTLLVRNRALAAVVLVALLAASVWMMLYLPITDVPLLDVFSAYSAEFPSDIVGRVFDASTCAQRLAYVLVSLGLLALAAAAHPRPDGGSRGRRALAGALLALAGVAVVLALVGKNRGDLRQVDAWRAAHAARAAGAAPDIEHVRADVSVEPGRMLSFTAELRVTAPAPLTSALFTLNPGLAVQKVERDGREVPFEFRDGLLDVKTGPLAAGATAVLKVAASGKPDRRFAFLDAARRPFELTPMEGQVFLMGYEALVFDRRHVALLPGTFWLPAAGAGVGRDDPRKRAPDFYDIDLTVELPEGWLAAGPGRRQPAAGAPAGRTRFRFAPGAPLPGAGLVVGRFVSHAAQIEGVWCELLLHARHAATVESLGEAAREFETEIGKKLKQAREWGLAYPYDGLTLVEVPNALRSYGGGWRMGSTLAPPGMFLVREMVFPTARWDVFVKKQRTAEDTQGKPLPVRIRQRVEDFFEADFSGGNVFTGVARNFLLNQTSMQGEDALALDYMLEDLATRALTGKQGYFSAHAFSRESGNIVNQVLLTRVVSGFEMSVADAVLATVTSRPAVWDAALETSLRQLDPEKNPRRAVDVLTLKAGAMSRSLLDELGPDRTGRMLGALLAECRGRACGRADLERAVAATSGEDFGPFFDEWLGQKDLPAFVAGRAEVFRVADEQGRPRYQARFLVHNEGKAPGLFRVRYREQSEKDEDAAPAGPPEGEQVRDRVPEDVRASASAELGDAIRVPAGGTVEIGLVRPRPPQGISVVPYLSLNRGPFAVSFAPPEADKVSAVEPFTGTREAAWPDADDGTVTVDDLDEGFEPRAKAGGTGLRLRGRSGPREGEEYDQGLPVVLLSGAPSRWSRMVHQPAHGRYRHTLAVVATGGENAAVFKADVRRAGEYRLELHLPPKGKMMPPLSLPRGKWSVDIGGATSKDTLEFDADSAEAGWNSLGARRLGEGEVTVEIRGKKKGNLLIADAVRWVPAGATR